MSVLRVLICDGYRDAADSAAMLLRLRGYECVVAYSGKQALDSERTFRPDAAVLALDLEGGVSGAEVGRQFAERGIVPIALSGYSDKAYRKRAESAGFKAYLLKPVNIDMLDATLQSVIALKCADTAIRMARAPSSAW